MPKFDDGLLHLFPENIAHAQSEYDAVLHTSVWEYPQFVNGELQLHLKTIELEVLR
jgi:hypothetical protein